jgi:predicted nuclease of predicted toxin-antitoxin system
MKILIDMNLSPGWCPIFKQMGWEAIHWSAIGDPRAPDRKIMEWAHIHHQVVFTHDLDFGVILALAHARGPSVVQVRTQNVLPDYLGPLVLPVLKKNELLLNDGALITIDEARARIRILPLS